MGAGLKWRGLQCHRVLSHQLGPELEEFGLFGGGTPETLLQSLPNVTKHDRRPRHLTISND